MKVLGIETSGPIASVAIVDESKLLGIKMGDFKVTHSQTLMPLLDQLLKETKVKLEDIDAIAVSGGPGSFTGLRIGAATAKGLALALDKPLVHVPTLHAMAYNLLMPEAIGCIIVPMIDARRKNVYCGIFNFIVRPDNTVDFDIFQDSTMMSVDELLEQLDTLTSLDGNPPLVVFLGDGAEVYEDEIEEKATFNYGLATEEAMLARADTVALVGQLKYRLGLTADVDSEAPEYFQVSQAERESKEKE